MINGRKYYNGDETGLHLAGDDSDGQILMAGQDGGTPIKRERRTPWLREGLLWVLAIVILWFAVATAGSFIGGTGRSKTLHSQARDVTATVQSCYRQGPVSLNGLGYWWTCRAMVDGATVELRHSAARKADVGHSVRVHELCKGENHTDCKYDRTVGLGWMVLMEFLHLIEYNFLPVMVFLGSLTFYRFVRPRRIRNSAA